MNAPLKQHLIDPEICIRCHACVEACPIDAITHDDTNVVVDASKCNFCMNCISPCPTGSIDNWRVVATPYALKEQLGWSELPAQVDFASGDTSLEALDDDVAALLAEAHQGAGGASKAPASASKPSVNLFSGTRATTARVQGIYRLTAETSSSDVRHIILDLAAVTFPVLEGQSIGITPPGLDASGKPHAMRLYSISSPRDGERPNTNNLSITVKRDEHGVCSNYLCDLNRGDEVKISGPFGSTFLMPNDPQAHLLMICTGTGSAPFRAFTMRRQRTSPTTKDTMSLYFGARTADALPYFGPLKKVPQALLAKHFAFSREASHPKHYVQDAMRENHVSIAALLADSNSHIFICGLRAMEVGVEQAFEDIARRSCQDWQQIRSKMRAEGRYHVETY